MVGSIGETSTGQQLSYNSIKASLVYHQEKLMWCDGQETCFIFIFTFDFLLALRLLHKTEHGNVKLETSGETGAHLYCLNQITAVKAL